MKLFSHTQYLSPIHTNMHLRAHLAVAMTTPLALPAGTTTTTT